MSSQVHPGFAWIAAMMFVTGLGIPVFAAFTTTLSQQLGGPVAAMAAAFAVGALVSLAIALVIGLPPREAFVFDRPYLWFGTLFILFYAVGVAYAAPRIGIGNAIFFVLLGQLVAAAAIDHFGWLGMEKVAITGRRALGIAVMALGVYLARKPM